MHYLYIFLFHHFIYLTSLSFNSYQSIWHLCIFFLFLSMFFLYLCSYISIDQSIDQSLFISFSLYSYLSISLSYLIIYHSIHIYQYLCIYSLSSKLLKFPVISIDLSISVQMSLSIYLIKISIIQFISTYIPTYLPTNNYNSLSFYLIFISINRLSVRQQYCP